MGLPGPSSLGRVSKCITSEALPHAHSSSAHSAAGDAVHDFLRACVNLGREAAFFAVHPEHRERVEAIPFDQLPDLDKAKVAAEVAFALNIQTGECRELGRGLTREEARAMAREGEMVGMADLAGLTQSAAVVWDWKTGHGDVDKAEVNKQVRTYGLMAARCWGLSSAIVDVVRVLEDGTVWHDRAEMDSMDLDAHEAELRDLMDLRAKVIALPHAERPPLHEGSHCKYCPALPFCPAKVTLLATVFDEHNLLEDEVQTLDPERAARAWARLEMAEKLLERLKSVVRDYARQHPFSTEDGYVVGEHDCTKETLVPERARAVLEARWGPTGAAVAGESIEVRTSMTKTALKTALRKLVLPSIPGGKITHLEKEALELLREKGAVSVASYKAVEEYKPKDPPAAKALPAQSASGVTSDAWSAMTPDERLEHARRPMREVGEEG